MPLPFTLTCNGSQGASISKTFGGAEEIRTPDPLLAKPRIDFTLYWI